MKILLILMYFCSGVLFAGSAPQWDMGVSVDVKEKDLDNNLKWAAEAGFKYLEAFVPADVLSDREKAEGVFTRFREVADKNGLKVWSIHLPFGSGKYDPSSVSEEDGKACREFVLSGLDAARKLGGYKKVVIHPSYEPIDPKDRPAKLKAVKKFFKEMAPLVKKKYGVQLLMEDLPRTCLANSSSETLDIINGIPDLGICFDVNHLLGEKTEHFAAKTGKHIASVHMSDYDEVNERHWLPGKGVIAWTKVVHELQKAGYAGPFMFEVTTTPWKDDMSKFYKDLSASWKKIQEDYAVEYPEEA